MGATALFVIDIQNDNATDPNTAIPAAARIITAGSKILATVRGILDNNLNSNPSVNLPSIIVFIQHEDLPGMGPLKKDTHAWKLVFEPRLDVSREILVQKTMRNAFQSNPNLASELKAKGVDHIVAFGIQSECCVEATCAAAVNEGFTVTLLTGAHSTYDLGDKSAREVEGEVEGRLVEKGVILKGWEEIVAEWGDIRLFTHVAA